MTLTSSDTHLALDTSVLLGLFDSQDLWHTQATALVDALERADRTLFYFDCVLAEMISALARRLHEKRREADLDDLLSEIMARCPPERITWILPDVPALYVETIDHVRASGGELNFNDALIALSCRNRGISHIVSFDQDFDQVAWLQRVAQPDDL